MRRRLDDGHVVWTTALDAWVTAMVSVPEHNAVVFALNDGHMGVLSAATGQLGVFQSVNIDGVQNVYLSLAARGSRIAAGTIDGRIVIGELSK